MMDPEQEEGDEEEGDQVVPRYSPNLSGNVCGTPPSRHPPVTGQSSHTHDVSDGIVSHEGTSSERTLSQTHRLPPPREPTPPRRYFCQTARRRVPTHVPTFSPPPRTYERGEPSYAARGIPVPQRARALTPPRTEWLGFLFDRVVENTIALADEIHRRNEIYDYIIVMQQAVILMHQSMSYFVYRDGRREGQMQLCMGVLAIVVMLVMWLVMRTGGQ
ncbi:hypothetical protein HanIR_Chr05g0245631 [Helianthus annuus]|nr:hypothetical protein HanIR_Chr05g0245631 [Helianthus annuus]